MNIFDNILSLILFKHQFTLMIVKSPFFEVQADFHHQMLVRLFSFSGQQTQSKVRCLSYYLHMNNPSVYFHRICLSFPGSDQDENIHD